MIGCQADYPPATPAGNGGPSPSRVQTPNGSSGISISGLSNTISIIGCVTAGSDVGIKVNTTSGQRSIQIDGCHGNTHLVAGIENIAGYVTANNYTARTGVASQGTGVITRAGSLRTKISDSSFIAEYPNISLFSLVDKFSSTLISPINDTGKVLDTPNVTSLNAGL